MSNRAAINQYLQRKQLATLREPKDLLQQLAMGITNHEKFRKVLAKVEPAKRTVAYETMRQFLSFKAKPLADYLMEAAQEAERKQRPTIDEKGNVKDFVPARNADMRTAEEKLLDKANYELEVAVPGFTLVVQCAKCTKEGEFTAPTHIAAMVKMREAGWVSVGTKDVCGGCTQVVK